MKKFNLSKGLIVGLLTFVLAIATFGVIKASAADETKTVTFKAKVGNDVKATYEVAYTPYKAAVGSQGDENYQAAENATWNKATDATLAKVIEELSKKDETVYVKSGDPVVDPSGKVTLADGQFSVATDATTNITVTIPVKVPTVTFTVTVTDMLKTGEDSEAGTYKFVTGDTFLKNKDVVTFADIIAGMKKVKDGNVTETTLADPSAWVVAAFADDQTDLSTYITKASDKLTLKKQLDKDLTFAFSVSNSKVPVKFGYTADGKVYTAVINLDNKPQTDTKILFADIVDNLKTTVTEENASVEKTYAEINGESIILADGFVSNTVTTGKYATWAYKFTQAGIATSAPSKKDIADKKIVSAFEIDEYDAASDSLKFVSPVELTVYWVDCKKSAGVQVKGDKVNVLPLVKNASNNNKYEASISLSDKEAGVKVAENKTAYIYASVRTPAEDKTKYTANYVIDATPYKKIAVTFAYAQAEKDSTVIGISTVTTTDNNKKTIVYAGPYDEETNKDHYLAYILGGLQYSADGTTWYDVVSIPRDVNGKQVDDSFTCGKLYEYINSGSKTNLFFRIKGHGPVEAKEAEGTEGEEGYKPAEDAKNAYRASKPIKAGIAVAKAGKALKIDVSKGTIALKNGYDFAMTDSDKVEPKLLGDGGVASAFTILPFNKAGKATRLDTVGQEEVKVVTDYCATVGYAPVAKVTDDATMFTTVKVKNYSIEKIARICGKNIFGNGNLYLWVRKSATAKKPADQWTLITIAQIAEAPTAKTDKAGYYTAQDPADTKGVVASPEVSNAKSDKTSGAYEYLIVDAADIKLVDGSKFVADIDFTSAKWTTLNDKGVTVAKSKSKYASEEGKKATDHVLKDGSAILIRRAGDKSSAVLASNYLVTMVAKQDVTYKDADNKDQTKSLYVWKAFAQAAE